MKLFLKKFNKLNRGYTIIETMIAVSLFLIITTIGMGALLNANLLHQKSQDMRSIMDSLNFIMEDMGRNLRTGYNYQCYASSQSLSPATLDDGSRSCADGWAIAFEAASGTAAYTDQWVYYMIDDANGIGKIYKSTDGLQSPSIQLTSDEIDIDQISGFTVLGAEPPPGNNQQPLVTIRLVGNITFQNVVTPFSLQTSVSQRLIDI